MNKFQQLIETLQTELIILIDDDFTPVTGAQEILTYICFMNQVDRDLMLQRLTAIDNTLVAPLNELVAAIASIEDQDDDVKFIEAGLLSELLNSKNEKDLIAQSNVLIESINNSGQKEDIDNLVMMYGLRHSAGTENYNKFFEGLKIFSPKKSIRLYKGLEGAEFTSFEQEIREVNQAKNSKFPLLIVDRYLSNSQDGNQIIQNLRENANGIDRFFSVLYTSKDVEQVKATSLQSYFHIQLRKNDAQALEKVSEALALSAFATFFDQIYKYRKDAMHFANQLVIESGITNMIYLAGMAHAEGDTVFNVFNNWFDLLSDKKVQDELLREDPEGFDVNFMVGLTNLINSDFISIIDQNGELDEDFHQEIKQLAIYEIFNQQVNCFCSPPAPGDIFEIDGQLYLLAGQECDVVVRSNGAKVCRNEKLAELIKCAFKSLNQDSKVASKVSRVTVNHFELNGDKGALEITLGDREFFDFRLLDLCSLNQDGVSRYASSNFPKQDVLKLLPEKWSKYIPHLINELTDKLKVQQFIAEEAIDPSALTGDYSFNVPHQNEDEMTVFPVKRIARIKGQFREYVMQRYWQYKTRKGLNSIGLYQRNLIQLHSFQAGFPYNLVEIEGDHYAWIQLTGNRDKNKNKAKLDLIIKKEEIARTLGESFEQAMNGIETNEIVISKEDFKENKIVFSKEWDGENVSLKIKFPLFNEYADHYFEGKNGLTIYDLFGKGFVDSTPNVKSALFVQGGNSNEFIVENGPPLRVDLEQLITGEIHILEENVRLNFDQDHGKFYKAGLINEEGNEEV